MWSAYAPGLNVVNALNFQYAVDIVEGTSGSMAYSYDPVLASRIV